MTGCEVCGAKTAMIIKDKDGLKKCPVCFIKESPIIDEGWRILKDAMDNNMEWEDIHAMERSRISARRNRMRR